MIEGARRTHFVPAVTLSAKMPWTILALANDHSFLIG
jgi:hypothetical protein